MWNGIAFSKASHQRMVFEQRISRNLICSISRCLSFLALRPLIENRLAKRIAYLKAVRWNYALYCTIVQKTSARIVWHIGGIRIRQILFPSTVFPAPSLSFQELLLCNSFCERMSCIPNSSYLNINSPSFQYRDVHHDLEPQSLEPIILRFISLNLNRAIDGILEVHCLLDKSFVFVFPAGEWEIWGVSRKGIVQNFFRGMTRQATENCSQVFVIGCGSEYGFQSHLNFSRHTP